MSDVVSPVYSALCDTDVVSYKGYLDRYSDYVVLMASFVGGDVGLGRVLGPKERRQLEGTVERVEGGGATPVRLDGVCGQGLVRSVCERGGRGTRVGAVEDSVVGKTVGESFGSVECGNAVDGHDGNLCGDRDTVVLEEVSCSSGVGVVPGKHAARNRAKKLKEKEKRAKVGASFEVPAWRRTAAGNGTVSSSSLGSAASAPSLAATVATVTTEVAEELEARRTLAARRVVENRVATKMGELRLASLQDKDKTNALAKLELARIQERINTATAKSQASYKKCDSPLDSVGSAGSAGEFAWKQEIRKRGVIVAERDSLAEQLDKAMPYISEEGRRVLAAIPTPYIPTDAEIEAMDSDISPHPSYEDMEAEAEAYFSRADGFFEH